ncbi:MAG: hypothetical protein JXA23_08415 [Bacteroidales bacterium]|nr:hypothetical protein [Bacteroidales bacterium]
MDHQIQERVQKTLDFIQKDREIPEDPWFFSRLTARMEKTARLSSSQGWIGNAVLRLRPILVLLLLLIGIAGGITLGRVLSSVSFFQEQTVTGSVAQEDASMTILMQLSGSFDEQILLMK